jgi:hypothetical protein
VYRGYTPYQYYIPLRGICQGGEGAKVLLQICFLYCCRNSEAIPHNLCAVLPQNIIQIAEIALQLLQRYAIIEKMEQEEFI